MSNVANSPIPKNLVKDKAQEYLMQEAKTNHQLVLSVLHQWLQADSKENFLTIYPESHPAHNIALATAIVGV